MPLDLRVGRKFGLHWVASVEYQYDLVRDDPRYNALLDRAWLKASPAQP